VAIVGQSGAGKSTIASLVQRNIPIGDGELFLAGADANTLTTDSARSLSATVGQTTFLFTGTLRENLQIAKPDASDEELWQALDTANLTQEISAMPQGLDTVVGERGYSLSGGQAQRLAIARALLKDAPLLILDEPTSQVDLEGEAAILAAIDNAVAGRTVLTIAHRPSTLRSVDRILTLADGNLTELGAGSTSNDGEES
jgi:ABC-type multidrug transport system fused ATPase/permease subunit